MPQSPDWDEAWLAARVEDEDPGNPDDYEDPDHAPPPGMDDDQLAALIAEALRSGASCREGLTLSAHAGGHCHRPPRSVGPGAKGG